MKSALLQRAASLVALLALWQAGAMLIGLLPPPPLTVAHVLLAEIADGSLPYHVAITLGRVAASFVLAMSIGRLGIAMGRLRGSTASATAGSRCSSTSRRWSPSSSATSGSG